MSKHDDTYIVAILALALIALIALWQFQESPRDAYERGYIDGRAAFSDTLWNRWLNDSLGWGFDSTDTMSAVEDEE